jgi:hypothetical protein
VKIALYICLNNKKDMKKLLVLGLFVAGFAMTSMAQNVAQPVENTPAVEVAKVAPAADAVAPVKACCKKEGSAGCSKAGAANGEVKACCKKEGAAVGAAGAPKAGCNGAAGAEHKCGGHEGAAVGAAGAQAVPATEKKQCGSECQKPCCKKGN